MGGTAIVQRVLRAQAVRSGVRVGERFHVGLGSVVWAPRELVVGDDVYIGKNVTIQVDGMIGDGVLIANAVGIVGRTDHRIRQVGTSVRRSGWVGEYPAELSTRTVIGSDVWVGYGATILSGVRVGDSAVVAAGSVVTADVPDNAIVTGNPATVRRQRFADADFRRHWQLLQQAGVRRTEPGERT